MIRASALFFITALTLVLAWALVATIRNYRSPAVGQRLAVLEAEVFITFVFFFIAAVCCGIAWWKL